VAPREDGLLARTNPYLSERSCVRIGP